MNREDGKRENGFSLVEFLVATMILSIIVSSGLSLYLNQQKQWVVQDQIAAMQQNARASMDALVSSLRMAGCGNFPTGMEVIETVDANPDSLIFRQALSECIVTIDQDSEPTVLYTADEIVCLEPGVRAYLWDNTGHSEWFTVDRVDTNESEGWHEIYAQESLINSYEAADDPRMMLMDEVIFFIDQISDADHPTLMRSQDGLPPQVFAENIEDLQLTYLMNDGTMTGSPGCLEDVKVIQVVLCARTERPDPDWIDPEHEDGYRRRTLESWVDVRNLGI